MNATFIPRFLIGTLLLFPFGSIAGARQEKAPAVAKSLAINGVDSAKDLKTIKDNLPFVGDWESYEWHGIKILLGLSVLPTDGESYIDAYGYAYNKSFKEWRRFCVVNMRHLGSGEIALDREREEIYVVGKANNAFKEKRVFTCSLHLISNDHFYAEDKEKAKGKGIVEEKSAE